MSLAILKRGKEIFNWNKATWKENKKIERVKKMTQQSLSDLCNIDIRTVQRIEKGEYGMGLHLLFAIADAFEIKKPDLFNWY